MTPIVTIAGEDVTSSVRIADFSIEHDQQNHASVCNLTILSDPESGVPASLWDEVNVYESQPPAPGATPGATLFGEAVFGGAISERGETQFGGYVTSIEPEPIRVEADKITAWHITARGYGILLETACISSASYSNTSDDVIVKALIDTYLPEVSTAGVEAVASISIDIEHQNLRQALESIASEAAAEWWLDADKILHYHSRTAKPAAFSLSESPNYATSFPFRRDSFTFTKDFHSPCNHCTVVGVLGDGSTPVSGTYQDTASQAEYGRTFKRVIVDRSVQSSAEAQLRAKTEVLRDAYPSGHGSLAFIYDGLHVDELLTLEAPSLDASGDYRILRMRMTWETASRTLYEIEFGDYRPNEIATLRKLIDLAHDAGTAPIAIPSNNSVGDAKLDRTTDPINITANDISSVNASSITGQITAGQIDSITAGQITGLIQANQINTITFGQVTSVVINDSHIGTIHVSNLVFSGESVNIDAGITYSGTGTFTISSAGGLSITAAGGLSVTGGDVTISASRKLSMAGATIELDGGSITGAVSFPNYIDVSSYVRVSSGGLGFYIGSTKVIDNAAKLWPSAIDAGSGSITGGIITGDQFQGTNFSIDSSGNLTANSLTSYSAVTGYTGIYVGSGGAYQAIDSSAKFIGQGGVDTSGVVDGASGFKVNGTEVINSSKQFVGGGVACPSSGIGGSGFNIYQSGWYYGVTGPTTFTTNDGKTVTVRGGIITSIA